MFKSALMALGSFVTIVIVIATVLAWTRLIRRSVTRDRLARMRRIMCFYSSSFENYGWYVELDGKKAAKLEACYDPRGNFIHCYLLKSMTADQGVARDILDGNFWDRNSSRITFRSCLTKDSRTYDTLMRGGFHPGPRGSIEAHFRNLGMGTRWSVCERLAAWSWRKQLLDRMKRWGHSLEPTVGGKQEWVANRGRHRDDEESEKIEGQTNLDP
jgi:hypothetical protein